MRRTLSVLALTAALGTSAFAQPSTTGNNSPIVQVPNPVVASGPGSLAQGINTSGHAVNAADSVVVQKHQFSLTTVTGASGAQSPTLVNNTQD